MGKIDTSGWKGFRVGELFAQERGKEKAPKQNEPGDCPLIQETNNNNGFDRMVVPTKIIKGNSITVSINYAQNVFYQADDFCASVNIAVLRNSHLNRYNSQFVCSVLRNAHQKFDYTSKISKELLNKEMIMLPVDKTGQPDWAYMESFMANLEIKVAESLTLLQAAKDAEKKKVDTREWGEFRVGELFEKLNLRFLPNRVFDKASDISEVKSEEFNLPLVNAKHSNNGIMYYGRKHEWEYEVLTIDIVADGAASTGDVYAQPQETGVLYNAYLVKPKAKCVTGLILFFLSTVIQRCVKNHFGYDNKCTWDKVKHETILLPVDKTGQPDWAYMEEYMMEVEKKTNDALNFLDRISTRRKIDGV